MSSISSSKLLFARMRMAYCTPRSSETLFIEPGSPWENRYVESFNRKLRYRDVTTKSSYRGMHLTPDDPTPCGRRLRRPHPRGAIGQRSWVL